MASPGPISPAVTVNRNDFDAALIATHDLDWVVFSRQWVQKNAKYQTVPLDTARVPRIAGSVVLVRIGKEPDSKQEELWASVPTSTTASTIIESVTFLLYNKADKTVERIRSDIISDDINIDPFPRAILAKKTHNLIPGRLNALAAMIAVAAYPNVYVRQPIRKFLYVQYILGAMAGKLKEFVTSEFANRNQASTPVTTLTRSSTPLSTMTRSFNDLIARPNKLPDVLTLSADALANIMNAPLEDAFAVALAIFLPGGNLDCSYPSLRLLRSKWFDEWFHEVMHNKTTITLPAYTTLRFFIENSDAVFGVAYNGTILDLWRQVSKNQTTGFPISSKQFVVTRYDSMTMWFSPFLTEEGRRQFKPVTKSLPIIKIMDPSYLQYKAAKSGNGWVKSRLPPINFFRGLSSLFVSSAPNADLNHVETHGNREKIDFLRDLPLHHQHRRSDNLEIQADIVSLWEPILHGDTNEYNFSLASIRTVLLLDPVVPSGAISINGNTLHLFYGNREGVVMDMVDNTRVEYTRNSAKQPRCIVFIFTSIFRRTRILVQGDGCPPRKDLLEGSKQHLENASEELEVTNVQGGPRFISMIFKQLDQRDGFDIGRLKIAYDGLVNGRN